MAVACAFLSVSIAVLNVGPEVERALTADVISAIVLPSVAKDPLSLFSESEPPSFRGERQKKYEVVEI